MMQLPDSQYVVLRSQVEALLLHHPEGLSEYELMQRLGWPAQSRSPLLDLFGRHFLLFHVLYRIRREWRELGYGDLAIGPLSIRTLPYHRGKAALAEVDRLEAYYLDLANLDSTSETEVAELLARFVTRYHAKDERSAALAELGLAEGASWETVRTRYRQLALQRHPDRGGDTERFQRLNRALRVLEQAYGKD